MNEQLQKALSQLKNKKGEPIKVRYSGKTVEVADLVDQELFKKDQQVAGEKDKADAFELELGRTIAELRGLLDECRQYIKRFTLEDRQEVDDQGHLTDYPGLGRFKKGATIELFSREMK